MNTNHLKSFAPDARASLIEQISARVDYLLESDSVEHRERAGQIDQLRSAVESEGKEALVNRIAYTWFNRISALRFMDAHGFHPAKVRIVTAIEGFTQPEVLQQARSGDLGDDLDFDRSRLRDVLSGKVPSSDPTNEAYRILLVAACHALTEIDPELFPNSLNDAFSELLLPADLLSDNSVLAPFRNEITDEDCADVEILGWLYQFYISEKKDEVMASKKAVSSDDIPYVTQLFTPNWIVRYMVENSLGRLWMTNRPSSSLAGHMSYYIAAEERETLGVLKINSPEEIKIIDPAVGSGHILSYAFDLLYLIYEEEGYTPSDIPGLILENNLYGVDICPRAAQLAELSLLFKSRQKSRRFFTPRKLVRPNITALHDIDFDEGELTHYFKTLELEELCTEPILKLLYQFKNATTLGSLIQPNLDQATLADLKEQIKNKDLGSELFLKPTHDKVLRALHQAEVLLQRCHCVIANPPYLWEKKFTPVLKSHMVSNFKNHKSNLFAAFHARASSLVVKTGFKAFMTPNVWMFQSSYSSMRSHLLAEESITSMVQLDNSGFDGAAVAICAFVTSTQHVQSAEGTYIRLIGFKGSSEQPVRTLEAVKDSSCNWKHRTQQSLFHELPNSPIAYWISDSTRKAFKELPQLSDIAQARQGLATGDNDVFLRFWHEINLDSFGLGYPTREAAKESNKKWFPYNKGGSFRKWYGNRDYVVNWHDDGNDIKQRKEDDVAIGKITPNNAKCWNQDYYFKSGITWSATGIDTFGSRLSPVGSMFDVKGSTCFSDDATIRNLLAFMNSCVPTELLRILSPSIEFQAGNIKSLPVIDTLPADKKEAIEKTSNTCQQLAQADWDNYETSWDFTSHPLLRSGSWTLSNEQTGSWKANSVEESWKNWNRYCQEAKFYMKSLEEENNRLWLEAYGMSEEFSAEVPEKQITLANADPKKDMEAFLSYVVGCIMGRFSPDKQGLLLANAQDTLESALSKAKLQRDDLNFSPDDDGIIPVLDDEWFDDDIVGRVKDFLRATFGDDTLKENIDFIEKSLGKSLRKYFVTDFYKNHISNERAYGYRKRPIYWLVQSPKKSFQALIYLHRYTKDTMNLVLNNYLREFEAKLENRLDHLAHVITSESASGRDKTKAQKDTDKIKASLTELDAWQKDILFPIASQRIDLDLDDGVKVNYPKFGKALAKIPGVSK